MLIAGINNSFSINGFQIEIIRNMHELSEQEKKELVKKLNQISIEAFNKETPMQETWDRTIGVDEIYLIKENGEILGYATNDTMVLNGKKINYFSSALFGEKLKSQGIYSIINQIRLNENPQEIIMTRTQNPLVMHSFQKLCQENNYAFFPTTNTPQEIVAIAQEQFENADNNLICKKAYGRALMENTPQPRNAITELYQKLNINQGDAMILIGMKN